MSTFQTIIAANILISLLSLVGVVTFLSRFLHLKHVNDILVSFAAGVMLTTALLRSIPEAIEMSSVDSVMPVVLGGLVFGFFIERIMLWYHHHHDSHTKIQPAAYLVIVGDGIHNFIDGVAIAAAYMVAPELGLMTAVAIAAHELPQEFADFAVLVKAGMGRFRAIVMNFVSALMALVGGVMGYAFLAQFQSFAPTILALSGGIFLYIATADLIPELHKDGDDSGWIAQIFPFVLGISIMIVLGAFSHGHMQ